MSSLALDGVTVALAFGITATSFSWWDKSITFFAALGFVLLSLAAVIIGRVHERFTQRPGAREEQNDLDLAELDIENSFERLQQLEHGPPPTNYFLSEKPRPELTAEERDAAAGLFLEDCPVRRVTETVLHQGSPLQIYNEEYFSH